jgi:hypothetical protein
MRTPPERNPNQLFNNADSFGIVFDEAWQRHSLENPDHGLSRCEKLELIVAQLAHHPFSESSPDLVRQVAEFRLRLHRL